MIISNSFCSSLEKTDSLWEGILKMTPSSYSVKRNRMEPLEGEDEKSTYNRMFAEMIDGADYEFFILVL
jgi:hypothetical protein